MKSQKDPFNLIISGVGGQGNILISRMIGRILGAKGYKVTIGETFGAAQRGGSVYSSMRISIERTYGPLIPEGHGHVILALEPLEALRMLMIFGNPDVVTIANTQPVYPVGVLAKRFHYPELENLKQAVHALSRHSWFLDATAMAAELKSPIVTNIVMLGAMSATGTLPISVLELEDEMNKTFPASALKLNMEAFKMGMNAVTQSPAP